MAIQTTWMERFRDSIAALCGGKEPPLELVEKWVNFQQDENGSDPLQNWVCSNTVLSWAQGLVILDAAHLLADTPEEGEDHLPYEKPQ